MDNLIRVIARDGSVMCCAVDSTKIAGEAERIVTHASLTAKPFFLRRGYLVKKEQQVEKNGIWEAVMDGFKNVDQKQRILLYGQPSRRSKHQCMVRKAQSGPHFFSHISAIMKAGKINGIGDYFKTMVPKHPLSGRFRTG